MLNNLNSNKKVFLLFNENKKIEISFENDFNSICRNDHYYIRKIKYLVKEILSNKIVLIENIELRDIKQLIKNMYEYSKINNFEFFVSQDVNIYIESKSFEINKKIEIGSNIKDKSEIILDDFKKFESKINELMVRKLRDQQMWDAFFGFIMQKSFNFSVPGSGKTSVVLAIFSYLKYTKKADKILMIGPLSSFKSWKDEFAYCFGKKPNVLDISSFNAEEKKRKLKNNIYENYDLIFINYHSVNSLSEFIEDIANDSFVVLDESHKVKSNNGVWSKACISSLKNAKNMILLTGTPVPNGISDLYMQMQILFNNEYNSFFKWSYNDLKNMQNIDNFSKKIYPFFTRTTKSDLMVPKANEDVLKKIEMEKSDEQLFELIYKKFKKSNPLEFIIRCMQASSNPKLLNTKISEEDWKNFTDENEIINQNVSNDIIDINIKFNNKFIKCVDFIKQLVEKDKTIILWCTFIETMNDFKRILTSENISNRIINGSVNLLERENIIDDFKNKKFSVLIANPHTISESVSLHHTCHDAIYYEYSYNLTHLIQSKDRIHRLGLKTNQETNYYFFSLINSSDKFNSIDLVIYEKLKEKEKIMLDVIENKEITNNLSFNNSNYLKEIIEKMLNN